MPDWKDYAKHGDLRSVIDSADNRGLKNKYINLLHHKILSDAIGNSLKGKRVLDLGCGIGRFTKFLQSCGAEVTGVDSCEEMLSFYTGYKKICASVNKLPFENESFDAVLSVWTLQYVDKNILFEVSKEINRVLVPGGNVYLIEQLSRYGYDSVLSRCLSDYQFTFENFDMINSRSIMRERDLLVGLIKKGIIPEKYFSLLIPYHLKRNKDLYLNQEIEYIDYFMEFRRKL